MPEQLNVPRMERTHETDSRLLISETDAAVHYDQHVPAEPRVVWSPERNIQPTTPTSVFSTLASSPQITPAGTPTYSTVSRALQQLRPRPDPQDRFVIDSCSACWDGQVAHVTDVRLTTAERTRSFPSA